MTNKAQLSLGTVLRSKNVIAIFVIQQLEIQVLDDLICSLHSSLIAMNFNIFLGLHVDQLLDFIEVFHSARSLCE